ATIRISIAGIGGRYDADLRLSDRREPESVRLSGRADGKLGSGEGEALVRLTEMPDGGTRLTYAYSAALSGKLAGIGHRLLDGVVKALIADFFERFAAHLRGDRRTAWSTLRRMAGMLRLLVSRR